MKKLHDISLLIALLIVGLLTSACSEHEDIVEEKPLQVIPVHLAFSLPQRIAGTRMASTRMTGDVVQLSEDAAGFRGLADIRLLCFNAYPTETTEKVGPMVDLGSTGTYTYEGVINTDYNIVSEIQVPVGITHVAFYCRANDNPTTHAEKAYYGTLERVGIDRTTYTGNGEMRFRPVQICPTTDRLGESSIGYALLTLVNELMNTFVSEPAPNNKWSTATHWALNESYQAMRRLTTSSSFNIQVMLGKVRRTLMNVKAEEPGYALAQALISKIEANCASIDATDPEKVTLLDKYQGFPQDINLPSGVARFVWNDTETRYEFPTDNDYGKGLNLPNPTDYVYPPNLQYQIFSDIMASDSTVLLDKIIKDNAGTTTPGGPNNPTSYQSWSNIIREAYADGTNKVEPTTQSVSMVKQVEYAVGRLATRVMLQSSTLYDAKGRAYDASAGFTLVGVLIGSQREVDYDFQPIGSSRQFAIYDTSLNGGPINVTSATWSGFNYTLGLSTGSDEVVNIALELVNNGADFEGADGTIVHGATFYLVAPMDPKKSINYDPTYLNQIYKKDFATKADITILTGWPDTNGDGIPEPGVDEHGNPKAPTGLATATYGLPALQTALPTTGLNVDLTWNKGLTFNEVPL